MTGLADRLGADTVAALERLRAELGRAERARLHAPARAGTAPVPVLTEPKENHDDQS